MALPRRLLLSPNYQLVTDTPHGEGLTNGDWRERELVPESFTISPLFCFLDCGGGGPLKDSKQELCPWLCIADPFGMVNQIT